jgi:steroid 5-alpha reductase family enzyme
MRLVVGGWIALALVMAVLWWRQQRTRDATSVDVAWSFGLAALAIFYTWAVPGPFTVRLLVGLLAVGWAGRLGSFLLLNRVLASPGEDGRYRALRQRWGPRADVRFFLLYQTQAAVAVLFSLPILGAMRSGRLDTLAAIGVVTWLIAVAGESLADRQLARFRANRANQGLVCRDGLWRYSRHPNYFFEWIHLDWAHRHARVPLPDHWDPVHGAAGTQEPGRAIPSLSAHDQRLRPVVSAGGFLRH